jgi:putative FmdB family regulatory protein
MPIYEYECNQCGHRLEAIQKVSDDPLTDCPSCHGAALRKLVSAAAFRLKGGGWYETDFKKDNRRNVVKSDADSSSADKPGKTPAKEKQKEKASSPASSSSSDSGTKAGAKTKATG